MPKYTIDLDVNLNPPSKTKIKKFKKEIGDLGAGFDTGSLAGFFDRMDTGKTGPSMLDKLFKMNNATTVKMLTGVLAGIGILGGILGVLKKVPSILQGSLKMLSIGFLLILKPLADMLGIMLMPIAKLVIKFAIWANSLKGIERGVFSLVTLVGLVAMALGGIAIAGSVAGGAVGLGAAAGATAALILLAKVIGIIAGVAIIYKVAMEALSWITDVLSTGWGILKDALQSVSDYLEGKGHQGLSDFFQWLANGAGFMETFTGNLSIAFDKLGTLSGIVFIVGQNLILLSKWIHGLTGGKAGTDAYLKYDSETGESKWEQRLASGGIVNSPTRALIGEAGPEAVIPLSQMDSMGGGTNITVNGMVDENKFKDIIKDIVRQMSSEHYNYSGSVM